MHRDAENKCSRHLRGCKGLEEGRGMTTPALWDLSIDGLQAPLRLGPIREAKGLPLPLFIQLHRAFIPETPTVAAARGGRGFYTPASLLLLL